MKGLSWLLLISAILVVLAILYKNREPFALEFIENTFFYYKTNIVG